jgi:hypothetical protein
VKTSLYSVFFLLVSDLATAFCFFPFLLLLWKKLGQEKAYLIISIYWLANGIINLPNWFGEAKNFQFQSQLSLLYNLIYTPLVLLVFYFSSLRQKATQLTESSKTDRPTTQSADRTTQWQTKN